jgi:hypothetical protein
MGGNGCMLFASTFEVTDGVMVHRMTSLLLYPGSAPHHDDPPPHRRGVSVRFGTLSR